MNSRFTQTLPTAAPPSSPPASNRIAAGITRAAGWPPATMGMGREQSSWGHYLMLFFLFLYCSRLPEFIPQARLVGPLQVVLTILMAATMRTSAMLKIPGGKLLLAFTVWSIICIPFSVWPTGALANVQTGLRTLLIVALIAAFAQSTREAIRTLYTIGLSMAFAASMSFFVGSTSANAGRLELAASNGTLGDPNYYCYYVLAGLPFLCLGAVLTSGLKRIAFLALIGPVLMVVGLTGSRMGGIAFAAGLMFIVYVAPGKQKILILAGIVGLAIVATVTLPKNLLDRFTMIFSAEEDSDDARMALGSTQSRQYLLRRGIEIAAANPIFGVGPGMFPIAEGADAATEGLKGAWHATHNSYVQIASEMGFPGALLYIAALFQSSRGLRRLRKSGPDTGIRRAAIFTQMSYVMVCVSILFLTIGYGGLPYVLIAASGALQAAITKEAGMLNRLRPAPFVSS